MTEQTATSAPASPARIYTAAYGVLGPAQRWVERPIVEVDARGVITRVSSAEAELSGAAGAGAEGAIVHEFGDSVLLPGLVNAHSHAFQRRIRGATHTRGASDPSDFWSWRAAMYEAASALDPEGVYEVTKQCFAEMLATGITCVGEFHYLHHQPDGRPYEDRNELSRQVIRAAREVGLRLVLLEVYYARAGAGRPPLAEQRRFVDGAPAAFLERVDALRGLADGDALSVGLAPHSVRAVPEPALRELAAYAREHGLVMHAHVSEQPRENEECAAEHGCTPTELLARAGCIDPARPGSFTAVHAIHVSARDRELLRAANVCACPTTEADLGDGIVLASEYLSRGTHVALGSDSNSVIDLIQEARLLEMHERLRARARLRLAGPDGQVGSRLLAAATRGGARALGRPALGQLAPGSPFDALTVHTRHRALAGVDGPNLLDALMLAGTAAPVDRVFVGGVRRR